jgi:CHAT domain-containing protein
MNRQAQKLIIHPKYVIRILFSILLSIIIHVLPAAIANPAPPFQPSLSNLMQQGKELYQTGQFQAAAERLQQAVQSFTVQEYPLNRALALSYLALTQQQLGTWQQAQTAINESVSLLPQTGGNQQERQVRAQVLNAQGRLQLSWGNPEAALNNWQAAIEDYQSLKDGAGVLGVQINQVQALRALGLYRRAQQQVEDIQAALAAESASLLKVASLRSLGEIWRVVGQLGDAKEVLEASLQMAVQLQSPQDSAAALMGLGNIEYALGKRQLSQTFDANQQSATAPYCSAQKITDDALIHYRKAIEYYQQSEAQAVTQTTRLQATLNRLSLAVDLGQQFSSTDFQAILTELQTLPPGRSTIYAHVNFSKSLVCSQSAIQPLPIRSAFDPSILATQVLQIARQQAETLGDRRATSYVLGNWGQLYEFSGDVVQAQAYTEQALNLAQQIQADDVAYQWQWQIGRLKRKQNDRSHALIYYDSAFQALQKLRRDLVVLNPDIQFSFREQVEPIYRQFVDLLLRQPNQTDLIQARNVIEALQLAELDNFFRDACSNAQPALIDQIAEQQDPTAATLYPIVLSDRIEVVLKLPNQAKLQHYTTSVSATNVNAILAELRQQLVEPYTIQTLKQSAAQVYDWLIRPAEPLLAQSQTKTLVFVLDSALRSIPMSALYDGTHYLVENYAVVLTPGLQLLNPKPLRQIQINALTGGLTESRSGFAELPNVASELAAVQSIIPTHSQLLNAKFIEPEIGDAIRSAPVSIVHLATHGRFSSQAEETFILAYDDKINVSELQALFQARSEDNSEAIELLVLSACETAIGDQRAALGLAGVAVRSGARSTLASLWAVEDASTAQLIGEFYRQLYGGTETNKATALRTAQLTLLHQLQTTHPRYWAAFVLLGNWL